MDLDQTRRTGEHHGVVKRVGQPSHQRGGDCGAWAVGGGGAAGTALLHTIRATSVQPLREAIVALGAFAVHVSSGGAHAAIGFVQASYATPRSPRSTISITFTSAQIAGNLNVVVVGWNDTAAAVRSVDGGLSRATS